MRYKDLIEAQEPKGPQLDENASEGGTCAANVATVVQPFMAEPPKGKKQKKYPYGSTVVIKRTSPV